MNAQCSPRSRIRVWAFLCRLRAMGSLIVPIISDPPFAMDSNSCGCRRRNRLIGIFTSGLFNPCAVECLSHFSKYCAKVSGISFCPHSINQKLDSADDKKRSLFAVRWNEWLGVVRAGIVYRRNHVLKVCGKWTKNKNSIRHHAGETIRACGCVLVG